MSFKKIYLAKFAERYQDLSLGPCLHAKKSQYLAAGHALSACMKICIQHNFYFSRFIFPWDSNLLTPQTILIDVYPPTMFTGIYVVPFTVDEGKK